MVRLLIALLLLLAGLPGPANAAHGIPPRPVPFRFVTDKAQLLKTADAKRLEHGLRKYADQTGTQIVVVTVPSLGGRDVADYGRQLGTAWGVGQRGKNNGLVVLLAAKEHKLTIQPGAGLRLVITSEVISHVINEDMTPSFKRGNYGAGLRAGLNTLMLTANPTSDPRSQPTVAPTEVPAPVSSPGSNSLADTNATSSNGMSLGAFTTVIVALAILALALFGLVKLLKLAFGGSGSSPATSGQSGTYFTGSSGGSRYGSIRSRSHSGLGSTLAAGAAGAAAGAYLASHNDDSASAKPDYFADGNSSSSSSPDYFSSTDSSSDNDSSSPSSYDDSSSDDTGGGGFDSSDSNSGSW